MPGLIGQDLNVPLTSRQPLRKITPVLEEKTSRDESTASITINKSPAYDEALAYYNECKALVGRPLSAGAVPFERHRRLEDYEKPLVLKMTARDWNKLRNDLELDSKDEAYPRFSFNASTSTLIIQCMPSAIHQSITTILYEELLRSRETVPVNMRTRTEVVFEEDYGSFGDRWSDSEKRPDLGIQICTGNHQELKWVLEVGFSETYDQLEDDVRLWLEGTSQVSMVTIVKFTETPPYRCPIPIYNDAGEELDPHVVAGIPVDYRHVVAGDVILNEGGGVGPATYKGLTWVGQITKIQMENWVRDPVDGRVMQRDITDLLQDDSVQLDFGDLLPQGYPQTITINMQDFHLRLRRSIRRMAIVRCAKAIKDYRKRHGENNGDYNEAD